MSLSIKRKISERSQVLPTAAHAGSQAITSAQANCQLASLQLLLNRSRGTGSTQETGQKNERRQHCHGRRQGRTHTSFHTRLQDSPNTRGQKSQTRNQRRQQGTVPKTPTNTKPHTQPEPRRSRLHETLIYTTHIGSRADFF